MMWINDRYIFISYPYHIDLFFLDGMTARPP
jgi:hypothetical protein